MADKDFFSSEQSHIMIAAGMETPFKMPIFYDFDVEADLALVRQMVTEVEALGGRVRAVVCDMGNASETLPALTTKFGSLQISFISYD